MHDGSDARAGRATLRPLNAGDRPELAQLMEAFHEVASGVEDAHRTLVQRLDQLAQHRPDSSGGGAGLESIPACDGVITLEVIERQAVLATLDRFGGHRQRTAQALGIGVRTLGMKLRAWKEAGLVAQTT